MPTALKHIEARRIRRIECQNGARVLSGVLGPCPCGNIVVPSQNAVPMVQSGAVEARVARYEAAGKVGRCFCSEAVRTAWVNLHKMGASHSARAPFSVS